MPQMIAPRANTALPPPLILSTALLEPSPRRPTLHQPLSVKNASLANSVMASLSSLLLVLVQLATIASKEPQLPHLLMVRLVTHVQQATTALQEPSTPFLAL
jgi:hypothetical protein